MHWAVILAGGSGTRFWPLSTPARPKQVLPLAHGNRSTAEETLDRLEGLVPPERTLVVTGAALAGPLQAALHLTDDSLLIEPRAASTAPALVWAAHEALRRDPESVLLCLHADWHIPEPAGFRAAAARALEVARHERVLVTVGVRPNRPETGYGYIRQGDRLAEGVCRVAQFTEKPTAERAAALVAEGALWNTGLFAWPAALLLEEVARHTPEVGPHLGRLQAGDVAGFFAAVAPVSIDVGLLERSNRVAVVQADFAWDDIGTWEALARVRPVDAAGNVAVGPAFLDGATGCIAWSDGPPIVTVGVQDLVIVAANGRFLVLPRERAADLKQVLDQLPPDVREFSP